MSFDLLDEVEFGLANAKVGIEEFAESDAYCGKPLFPGQKMFLKLIFLEEMTGEEEDLLSYWISGGRGGGEIHISPQIRERRDYLRAAGHEHFKEIELVGGRRAGKGHITGLAGAYKMWNTHNLQDPHAHYGIDRDKTIVFFNVAASEAQAKDMQYADFSGSVRSCAAFEKYIKKDIETEFRVATPTDMRAELARRARGVKTEKVIASLQGKALAANANTLRGSATIFLVMDEMAHMQSGESKASAEKVYEAAMPALAQFGNAGLVFCNSSPYSKVGKFYERFQSAMTEYDPDFAPGEYLSEDRSNGDPMEMALQFPSWAMFEGYKKYKSKWKPNHVFKEVMTASADWDPNEVDENGDSVWSDGDRTKIIDAKATEAKSPETYRVERRAEFAEVIDSYLNSSMVDRMFEGTPGGFDEGGRPIYRPFYSNVGHGATNRFRYRFHLDPSSTTAGFGFAIGHVEEFMGYDGNPEPHVVFDLIKRWNPKDFPGSTIDWRKIINEVIEYADIFRPEKISLDQFQSEAPIQTLRIELAKRNIGNVIINKSSSSNEDNWYAAESFKTALNHGLVHAPKDCLKESPEYGVDQELKFLQQKNTGGKHPRVERQFGGPVTTKDMADCVMFITEGLIGNQLEGLMRSRLEGGITMGAPGGYQIGGNDREGGARGPTSDNPMMKQFYGETYGRQGEQRMPRAARPRRSSSPARSAFRGNRRR